MRAWQTELMSPFSLTTEFLSNLATLGLKACLARWEKVAVRVISKDFFSLLKGEIDQVEVQGLAWQSPRGLSCRALSVHTEPLALDLAAILSGKILLKQAVGATAQVALNADDFAHLLVSPLLDDYWSSLTVADQPISALRVDDLVDGKLLLSGQWQGTAYQFELQAGTDGKALVSGSQDDLARALADFFNHLMIDLQGLELRLDKFTITQNILHLDAKARVWQFPQKALNF